MSVNLIVGLILIILGIWIALLSREHDKSLLFILSLIVIVFSVIQLIWSEYSSNQADKKITTLEQSHTETRQVLTERSRELQIAGTKIVGLEENLSVQEKEQAQTKKDLAARTTELEAAKSRLEQLVSFNSPREITKEDRAALLAMLSRFKGMRASVSPIVGDQEAMSFAKQLQDVLIAAGWQASGHNVQTSYEMPNGGCLVQFKASDLDKYMPILKALTGWGNVQAAKMDNFDANVIEIIIGQKNAVLRK